MRARAQVASCVRFSSASLVSAWRTWLSTVRTESWRREAIAFVREALRHQLGNLQLARTEPARAGTTRPRLISPEGEGDRLVRPETGARRSDPRCLAAQPGLRLCLDPLGPRTVDRREI